MAGESQSAAIAARRAGHRASPLPAIAAKETRGDSTSEGSLKKALTGAVRSMDEKKAARQAKAEEILAERGKAPKAAKASKPEKAPKPEKARAATFTSPQQKMAARGAAEAIAASGGSYKFSAINRDNVADYEDLAEIGFVNLTVSGRGQSKRYTATLTERGKATAKRWIK